MSNRYLDLVSIFDEEEVETLTGEPSDGRLQRYVESYFDGVDSVKDSQIFDMENFLEHLLTRADKMTMAHSVEAREPFLDHALVEFAFSLPRSSYLDGKRVLKKSLKGVLPPQVIGRRKNRFFVPIHHWFATELGEYFWEAMDHPQLGIYEKSYLDRIKNRYYDSPLYYARQMWSILSLESWYEEFFDGQEIRKPIEIASRPSAAQVILAPR